MKKIAFIKQNPERHWVGDGFPVRTVFSYNDIAEELSPFLLLDYAGPVDFPATTQKLGVGEHPHRGFETVTIVYAGEVEHRDSSGGGGKIGPGDVQWMTAGAGIVHEEFHGREYAKQGGPFEMIQLWVNLAKKDKRAPAGYQGITSSQIPSIQLPGDAGQVRVIAGEYQDHKGPAKTFSAMNVWDVRMNAGHSTRMELSEDHTASIFVLQGSLKFASGETAKEAELVVFGPKGTSIELESTSDSKVLLLSGKPLNEPIVGYGPFVMNTEDEIKEAFLDYRSGKMGRLT